MMPEAKKKEKKIRSTRLGVRRKARGREMHETLYTMKTKLRSLKCGPCRVRWLTAGTTGRQTAGTGAAAARRRCSPSSPGGPCTNQLADWDEVEGRVDARVTGGTHALARPDPSRGPPHPYGVLVRLRPSSKDTRGRQPSECSLAESIK